MYCYCKWSVLEFPDMIMSLLMYSGTSEIISKIMVLWVKKADDEVAFKLIFFLLLCVEQCRVACLTGIVNQF